MTEMHERYMAKALELAARPAFTSPNPRVGCVVVRDDQVISEGFHEGAGTEHAEAVALKDVDARGATLYVNLEPCDHQGRMPPCAPAIVAAGIERVVIATEDPDPRVDGGGIAHLRSAGIKVDVGVLAERARRLNRAFFHRHLTGRSFLTLKLAMSLDGKVAATDGSSRWITSEETRKRVHARRLEADAVMVGAGTVLADDPLLTARHVEAPRQPLKVIIDPRGRTPTGARVLKEPGSVLIATSSSSPHEIQTSWKESGAEVLVLPSTGDGVDVVALLEILASREVLEVYCEGGAKLATHLLKQDAVDALELHYGPLLLGEGVGLGELGIGTIAEARRLEMVAAERSGEDLIVSLERSR